MPRRQLNGYREYTSEHVATLRLAKALRGLRLPLAEVAPLLKLAHDGTCGEIRDQLADTLTKALTDVDSQLAELTRTRDLLSMILEALEGMRASDSTVPGWMPCECVKVVTSSQT